MRHPDVILIYTPDDDSAAACGCHLIDSKWKFSKFTSISKADVSGFVDEMVKVGMICVDVQLMAETQTPGMSAATPLILCSDTVSLSQAIEAFTIMHTALLKAGD